MNCRIDKRMRVKGQDLVLKGIRNILLIQLGDIGDVVLSLPTIRALKENFPSVNLRVAVLAKAKGVLEDCPGVTKIIAIHKDKNTLAREMAYQKDFFLKLRKTRFDLVFDLRTGTRGAILAFLSGASQRVGFYAEDGKLWRNRLFTHLANLPGKPGQHIAEYYLELLVEYGIKTENKRPELHVSTEKRNQVRKLLENEQVPPGKPIIAIQPFSLWAYKEWGKKNYANLIDWIGMRYDLSIILIGSSGERVRAEEIVRLCQSRVYNLAGKTPLGLLAALLNTCGLFIGGDSAGMHIAAAAGTATVSIFGSASPVRWAPRGQKHVLIQKDFPCVPCDRKGCEGSGFSRCLAELKIEEVALSVKEQIGRVWKNC